MKNFNRIFSFFGLASFALLSACSDDTTDVASVMDNALDEASLEYVSFEGQNYNDAQLGLFRIRFVGAHTAYATVDAFKGVTDGEVLCEYSAVDDTMTLQVQKIPAYSGGPLLSEQEFILFWNSDAWRKEVIGYHDGTWAKDGFEIETKDVKIEKTGDVNGVSVALTVSDQLKDTVTTWIDEEDGVTEVKDTIQVFTGFTAVFKNVTIENGTKTTTTITRKYTEDVAEYAHEFYEKYKVLSDDNWRIVHNMFLPFTYSIMRDYSITVDLGIDGNKDSVTLNYDLVLMQHYTELGNASFVEVVTEGSEYRLSYFTLSSGEIVISRERVEGEGLVEYDKKNYYKYVSGNSDQKTFTFEEFKSPEKGSVADEKSIGTIMVFR